MEPPAGKKKRSDYPAALSIGDHQEAYYKKYLKRESSMQGIFDTAVKIVDELLSRAESEMFRGMQYKSEKDPTQSNWDPRVSKDVQGLGKLVTSLQTSHLRLLKEGEKQANNMSLEAQISACITFVKKLAPGYRAQIKRDIAEIK